MVGAKIGIGIRGGIIHIELERPCIISIIPITTEIGVIAGIKIGIICKCFFFFCQSYVRPVLWWDNGFMLGCSAVVLVPQSEQ